MKKRIVHLIAWMLLVVPSGPKYYRLKQWLLDHHHKSIAAESDMLRLYSGKITTEIIKTYKKVLVIQRGLYEYDYFNICFFNNVISLCLKAVCEGFLPQVEIYDSKGENIWEQFFTQPFSDISREGKERIVSKTPLGENYPQWTDIFNEKKKYWSFAYQTFTKLNIVSEEYINDEIQSILYNKHVLGALCRGTDYTMKRPKGHPIQPDIDSILQKTELLLKTRNYSHIYLATEDSKYEKAFRQKFGSIVLTNKRTYYDDTFSLQKLTWIKDVHFNRENDDYLKGLEYLSSLMVLSKCQGIVAGNCGGTQAAVFWNDGRYKDVFVFNLGEYQ